MTEQETPFQPENAEDSTPAQSAVETAPEQDAVGQNNATGDGSEAVAPQADAESTRARAQLRHRADYEESALSALERHVRELAHNCGIAVEDLGVVRGAHALLTDVHKFFVGTVEALTKSQAVLKSFTEARAPFPDGIYDHRLTGRREQFLNGKLVFAVSAELVDSLGPTALPHQYRGTWGSLKDVPQG